MIMRKILITNKIISMNYESQNVYVLLCLNNVY